MSVYIAITDDIKVFFDTEAKAIAYLRIKGYSKQFLAEFKGQCGCLSNWDTNIHSQGNTVYCSLCI